MSWRIFVFLSLVFLLFTSREPPWADAHVTYDTTQALWERWSFDVHTEGGPPWFYAHREGKKYGVFPLGNVVAMLPSYVTYKSVHALLPSLPDKPLFALASHVSPSLMMAGACALLWLMLRRRGASPRWALFGTLATAFSTLVFIYARAPYSEAVQTLALLWLVERTLAQGEETTPAGLGWLGLAAGVLINTKLVYVLLLPCVAAYLIVKRRQSGDLDRLWRAVPLAALAFAELTLVALWHNHIKTGSVWVSGYQIKDGVFSGDLLPGLYGFVLSTGKSAFLYSPPLVLGCLGLPTAWRRRKAETAFILSVIVVCTLFNAKFRHWHADYCWGPRHLTSITPLVMLLAFPWLPRAIKRGRVLWRQIALGSVLGLGLTVQLLGGVFYWDHYIRLLIAVKDQTGGSGWFQENLSHGHYIPEFSPLRGHVWMLRHLIDQDPDLDRDAPWKPVMPLPADLSEGWRRLRPDWWAIDWFDPAAKAEKAGAALLALLVAGSVTSALGLSRALRRELSPRPAR